MNQVHLSGTVFDEPRLVNKQEAMPHLVFRLLVKHRSKAGIQKELYRISAWNQCAAFCSQHLKRGMGIALQGYLAQREIVIGDKPFTAVEVAISEVLLPRAEGMTAEGAEETEAPAKE